jgi:AcrR family transcriptional regulator
MALQRGERQTLRTKEVLESAFIELVQEKSYHKITINDITDRANTGRSTFYRYFQTKADVVVSLHAAVFDHFSLGLSTPADWLAAEPPSQLVRFLRQYETARGFSSYKLGDDLDYVMRGIETLLARRFEESLHRSFAEADSAIPFYILAQSIAGTYSWLTRAWFMERCAFSADQLATYIHRLTRAAIREAFSLKG